MVAGKVSYRLIPYGAQERKALEGWLEEKAREGLIFEEISFGLAKFRRGDPSDIRFLVVPVPTRKLTAAADMRSVYRENGWSYVTYYALGVDIYKGEAQKARAIPVEREQEAQWIKRGWRREGYFLLFLLLLAGGLGGHDLFCYLQRPSKIIEQPLSNLLIWPVLIAVIVVAGLILLGQLLRMRRLEARGELRDQSVHTPQKAKAGRIKTRISVAVAIVVIVGVPFLPLGDRSSVEGLSLEDAKEVPFLLWSEIDPVGGSADGFVQIYRHAFLAPTVLRLAQWKNTEEGTEKPYDATYYELRSEALADRLAREFSRTLVRPSKTEKDGMLTVYGKGAEGEETLVIRYQARVLWVLYQGEEVLYPLIHRYEEKLLSGVKT